MGFGDDSYGSPPDSDAVRKDLRELRAALEDRELACLAALSREKVLVAALTEAQAVAQAIDEERTGEAAKAREATAALAESERARVELSAALSGLRSGLAAREAEVTDLRARLTDSSSSGEAARTALTERLRAATERANEAAAAALAAEARASALDAELRTVRGDAQGMFRVITVLEEQLAARDGAEGRVNAALLERDAALNREAQARATADRAVEALRAESQAAEAALASAREETKRATAEAEAHWAAKVREAAAAAAEARAKAERAVAERAAVEADAVRARARVEAEAEHARREGEALRRRLATAEEERDAAVRASKEALAKGAYAAEEARRERDAAVARLSAAEAAVEAAQRRCSDAEAAAEGSRRARKEAEAEAERLRREADEARHANFRSVQRAGREAEAERVALETRLRETEAEVHRLGGRAAALEAEREGREAELQNKWRAVTSHQEAQLLACAEEIMRLRGRCEELAEAAAASQREAHALAVSRDEAIAGLYHLRSVLDAAETAHAEVSAQLSAALAREDHAAAHLQDARAEAERLRLASRRLEAQLAHTKDALEASEAGRRYLEGVLAGGAGNGSAASSAGLYAAGAAAASSSAGRPLPGRALYESGSTRLRAVPPPPAAPVSSAWYGTTTAAAAPAAFNATYTSSMWGAEGSGAGFSARGSPRGSSAPPSSASSVASPYPVAGFPVPLTSPAGASAALPVSVRASPTYPHHSHHHHLLAVTAQGYGGLDAYSEAGPSPSAASAVSAGSASSSAAHLLTTTLLGARASPHSHTRHTAARVTPASERAAKANEPTSTGGRRRSPPLAASAAGSAIKTPRTSGPAEAPETDAAAVDAFVARLSASTPQPGSARGANKRTPASPPVLGTGVGARFRGSGYSDELLVPQQLEEEESVGEEEQHGRPARSSGADADAEDTEQSPSSSYQPSGLDSRFSSGGFSAPVPVAAVAASPSTAVAESLRLLGRESPRHPAYEAAMTTSYHSYSYGGAEMTATSPSGSAHHSHHLPVSSPRGMEGPLSPAGAISSSSSSSSMPSSSSAASLHALEAALLGGPVAAAVEAAAAHAHEQQHPADKEEEEEEDQYEDDEDFEQQEEEEQEQQEPHPVAAAASPLPALSPAPRAPSAPSSPDVAGYGDDFEVEEEEEQQEEEGDEAGFEADSLAGTQRLQAAASPLPPSTAAPASAFGAQFDQPGQLDDTVGPQLGGEEDDSASSDGLSDYF